MALFHAGAALGDEAHLPRGFAAGDVMVRARLSGIIPFDVRSNISLIGGQVDVPRMVMPDGDISYFLSEHWSVTGQTGAVNNKIKIRNTAYGDINVGTVWALPLSLAVQYHFLSDGRYRPYAGVGMIANWYFGEKPAGGFGLGYRF